ncbi:MAG TPA: hypothetical protein VEB42_04760, partial [Chitinophagaceae bacterium]|nr:hypothetical protein [Chitinophagaceae bacterium]
MKQYYRACIKGVVTGLLLLLLHAISFAQDDTILPPVADTEIVSDTEYSVTTYDSDDQSARQQVDTAQEVRVFRKVPDSVISYLQRQKEFAYANDPA